MSQVIKITKLKKSYFNGDHETPVLHGIDFTLNKGEMTALMGPSGSGKSTFLNILGLLDKPSSGTFLLDGVDTISLTDNQSSHVRNKKIGFVFQAFNLLSSLTIHENVKVPMFYSKIPPKEQNERASYYLDRVKMSHRTRHTPLQLSGGEMQRVALARALVMNPSLILADEPTGNLDEKTSLSILSLFDEIHESGTTILMVTHNPEMKDRVEKVVRFKNGLVEDIEAGGKTITKLRE